MRHQLKRSLRFGLVEPARHLVDHALASLTSLPVTRLCVISDDEVYTSEQQLAPLRAHRSALRAELGVVFGRMLLRNALAMSPAELARYDALLLKLSFRTQAAEAVALARTLRERAGPRVRLLYLDGDDDLCVQWPELLEYVDLYVKKQVFRDRAEYERPRIGKTNLTDHVARTFGVSFEHDPIPSSRGVERKHLHKIVPGWNLALDDKIRALHRVAPAIAERDIDVICRANVPPNVWIHPLRSPVAPILERLASEHRVLTPAARVSQEEYYREMRRSRICVSPFGYGELCWRDIEAILSGCLLVKPDVGHLETEPDVFVPLETYVPVRWDFADLEEVLRHYLAHPEERERICRRARAAVIDYEQGGFVRTFARVLAQAGINTTTPGPKLVPGAGGGENVESPATTRLRAGTSFGPQGTRAHFALRSVIESLARIGLRGAGTSARRATNSEEGSAR